MESQGDVSSSHISLSQEEKPLAAYSNWDVLHTLPTAMYVCDKHGTITAFNEPAAELWGRRPQVGKDLWCGSHKSYTADGFPIQPEANPTAVSLKEKRAFQGEEMIIERPDGMRIHVLPFPGPVFDAEGQLSGIVTMLVDISAQKTASGNQEAPDEIQEKITDFKDGYDKYHKMIDEVQDYAILMLDLNGLILNWNKGAERIKGYTEAEVIGRSFNIFYREEDLSISLPQRLIGEAYTNGRAMHEGWRKRKDGSLFWGSVVITALHNDDGSTIGFSKVTRDLTERKIAEDQMKEYARNIEIRNKQLEEYAFIASHDLQEPLRKIQTFANLLEKNLDNKEATVKHIEKINSSAHRMSLLIKDVLNYSRLLETSELFLSTDLTQILINVIEDLDLLIEEKQARVIFNKLPAAKVIPIQIHQLFSNLITNSLKFSRTDPVIEVSAESLSKEKVRKYTQLDDQKKYLRISFKDNGIGFDQEFADKAFRLFQKLHSNISGTGIGLAICKKVVENHQGIILVTSQPDEGATFDIFLPELA